MSHLYWKPKPGSGASGITCPKFGAPTSSLSTVRATVHLQALNVRDTQTPRSWRVAAGGAHPSNERAHYESTTILYTIPNARAVPGAGGRLERQQVVLHVERVAEHLRLLLAAAPLIESRAFGRLTRRQIGEVAGGGKRVRRRATDHDDCEPVEIHGAREPRRAQAGDEQHEGEASEPNDTHTRGGHREPLASERTLCSGSRERFKQSSEGCLESGVLNSERSGCNLKSSSSCYLIPMRAEVPLAEFCRWRFKKLRVTCE